MNEAASSSPNPYFMLFGIVYITQMFFCLWLPCPFSCLSLQCDSEIENMLQCDALPGNSWSTVIDARRSCCNIGFRWDNPLAPTPGVVRGVCKLCRIWSWVPWVLEVFSLARFPVSVMSLLWPVRKGYIHIQFDGFSLKFCQKLLFRG